MTNMSSYVLGFHDLDRTKFALDGGKGANLGELSAAYLNPSLPEHIYYSLVCLEFRFFISSCTDQ